MLDKNGKELKTGMTVRITGSYFKNANGTYFISHSPGDPSWTGRDHCLYKINRNGTLSQSPNHVHFWPLVAYVNDALKSAKANEWNKTHAEIEIIDTIDRSQIKEYFLTEARNLEDPIQRGEWRFGEDNPHVILQKKIKAFYEEISAGIDTQPTC